MSICSCLLIWVPLHALDYKGDNVHHLIYVLADIKPYKAMPTALSRLKPELNLDGKPGWNSVKRVFCNAVCWN